MIALSNEWRVRPFDHLQWIVEYRVKPRGGGLQRDGARWLPHAYCRTKDGLRCALSREGVPSLDLSKLDILPDRFPEKAEQDDVGSQPLRAAA